MLKSPAQHSAAARAEPCEADCLGQHVLSRAPAYVDGAAALAATSG